MAKLHTPSTPVQFELVTVAHIVETLRQRLQKVSDTPSLDAQVLLAHIMGKSRSWLLAHPQARLNMVQSQALEEALLRLEQGEPLPYVLGHWEFYGLDFIVSPAVLIPRPETELLVEQALAWLRHHPQHRRVADVGTGSGCIAITLAVHIPDVQVLATDLSPDALRLAQTNAQKHGVAERIHFVQADLLPPSDLSPLPGPLDLILANLPYIPTQRLPTLNVTRWEPILSLDGGADGMALIRRLLHLIPGKLAADGLLLLEIDASQGRAVASLAQSIFPQARVQVLTDLSGLDRLVRIEVSASNA
jgi:release factor glutamine methyltransferase